MHLSIIKNLVEKLLSQVYYIKRLDTGLIESVSLREIGYTFQFDNAKRRFGLCNYRLKTISLSKPLCEANPHQIEGKIRDTILHEIAHAISYHLYGSKGKGHGIFWKNTAKQIGSDAKRCYSVSDFGGIERPPSKYTMKCNSCGKEYPKHRKPRRRISCGVCSKVFDSRYLLELIKNY